MQKLSQIRNFSVQISARSQKFIDLELKYGCHNYKPNPVVIHRGKGIYLYDVDNRKFFDFIAGYSAVNQGHCHPRILKVLKEQCEILNLNSRALYNDKLGLAEKYLTELLGFDKTLITNTGVEAGETALKLARRWGYYVKKIPSNQAKILFAIGNFWGRSLAACASSEDPYRHKDFGPFEMNFELIEYNNIIALEDQLKSDPNIVAYMLEPIQGEKGVIVPSEDYLQKVRDLCTKYKVLMIADEVQTGLGRTGKMLGVEHAGVRPDILILGKALSGGVYPISAVLADDEIMMTIKPGEHGSTFGGNPLASAIMTEALKVIQEEDLIANSAKMGQRLLNNLQQLKLLPIVKQIRGKGLLNAIEFHPQANRNIGEEFCYDLIDNGVLARQTQQTIIRLNPPLTITADEIDQVSEILIKTAQNL